MHPLTEHGTSAGLVALALILSQFGVRRGTSFPILASLLLVGWGLERLIVSSINTANRS